MKYAKKVVYLHDNKVTIVENELKNSEMWPKNGPKGLIRGADVYSTSVISCPACISNPCWCFNKYWGDNSGTEK